MKYVWVFLSAYLSGLFRWKIVCYSPSYRDIKKNVINCSGSRKMKKNEDRETKVLYKGVAAAYLILILHVLLIAAMGLLVVFFGGIINYMLWIFLGFSVVIVASGYYIYRRMKRQGKQLKDTLNSPAFNGRSVEISFLGGLASFRIGGNAQQPALNTDHIESARQLEDPENMRIRQLSELVKLYENELISVEEFNTLKSRIIDE